MTSDHRHVCMTSDHRHVCPGSFLCGFSLSLSLFCALLAATADSYAGVIGCLVLGLLSAAAAKFFYLQIPRR